MILILDPVLLPKMGYGEFFDLGQYREKHLAKVHPDLIAPVLAYHLREGFVVPADLTGDKPMFQLGNGFMRSKWRNN